MNQNQAIQLWAKLSEEGKAPTELMEASRVLPSYTAGIEPWLDRLVNKYLRGEGSHTGLCRTSAHTKLVLAPYGGGKTHFLFALGGRALKEGFAASYIPCDDSVGLDSPLNVYQEFVKKLYLPEREEPGLRSLLSATIHSKRAEIERHDVPDVDSAFRRWVFTIRRKDYPENAFGRVMAAALEAEGKDGSDIGDAAFRWLQGESDSLSRYERDELSLSRISAADRRRFGRNLLLSIVKFLPEAGVHGLVLLMDEVETLFAARGRALRRILAAMRVMVDIPDGVPGGLPLFSVFSAVPDILEDLEKYPALQQRLAVYGASFDEGNDLATQLQLSEVQSQETLLAEIGEKLIEVGAMATGHSFDRELQRGNVQQLTHIASEQNLDVDARRVFVKTWVSLLQHQIQSTEGERAIGSEELTNRYKGSFDSLKNAEEFEP